MSPPSLTLRLSLLVVISFILSSNLSCLSLLFRILYFFLCMSDIYIYIYSFHVLIHFGMPCPSPGYLVASTLPQIGSNDRPCSGSLDAENVSQFDIIQIVILKCIHQPPPIMPILVRITPVSYPLSSHFNQKSELIAGYRQGVDGLEGYDI